MDTCMALMRTRMAYCRREVFEGEANRCILHSSSALKDQPENKKRFYDLIREIRNGEPPYDFTAFVFPKLEHLFSHLLIDDFDKETIFSEATFQGDVSFHTLADIMFKGPVTFKDAVFLGRAEFSLVGFNDTVKFEGTKFMSDADFSWATFDKSGRVVLDGAKFEKHANFHGTKFLGDCSFENAVFAGRADFTAANFNKAYFSGCVFETSVLFLDPVGDLFPNRRDDVESSNDENKRGLIMFDNVILGSAEKLVFARASLERCIFIGTNLSKVTFSAIKWNRDKGRIVLYDEEYQSLQYYEEREQVGELYRQLKHNYEDQRDFATAGDFHISEMEMRRLGNKGVRKYFSLLAFYKYLSNYGESYKRTGLWLVSWLLFLSTIFLFIGFKSKEGVVKYKLAFNTGGLATLFTGKFWGDFTTSAIYVLSIFSFKQDKYFESLTTWGRNFEILIFMLSAILIALFLLAVRRRFQR